VFYYIFKFVALRVNMSLEATILNEEQNPNSNVELLPYAHFIVSHQNNKKIAWIFGHELAEWYSSALILLCQVVDSVLVQFILLLKCKRRQHHIFDQHSFQFRDLISQHLLAQHFQVWLEALKKFNSKRQKVSKRKSLR